MSLFCANITAASLKPIPGFPFLNATWQLSRCYLIVINGDLCGSNEQLTVIPASLLHSMGQFHTGERDEA